MLSVLFSGLLASGTLIGAAGTAAPAERESSFLEAVDLSVWYLPRPEETHLIIRGIVVPVEK